MTLVYGFNARGWQHNQLNWVELLSVTFGGGYYLLSTKRKHKEKGDRTRIEN